MDGLLLKGGIIVFFIALVIILIKMLAIKGWAFRYLVGTAVVTIALFIFGGFVTRNTVTNLTAANGIRQADGSDKLLAENRAYGDGLIALSRKDYTKAMDLFTQVSPDDQNYRDARAKLQQAKLEYANQLLVEGKDKLRAGDFTSAVKLFNLALTYNSNLEEGKALKQQAQAKIEAMLEKLAAKKAAAELAQAKKRIGQWEFGSGSIGIAVGQTKVSSTVITTYGFDYDSRGSEDSQYLWLLISALNNGNSTVSVNPDDFTLVAIDGYRVTRNEATFSQKYFKAKDLAAKNTNEGWIIFFVPKGSRYTLQYYGPSGSVNKVIVL